MGAADYSSLLDQLAVLRSRVSSQTQVNKNTHNNLEFFKLDFEIFKQKMERNMADLKAEVDRLNSADKDQKELNQKVLDLLNSDAKAIADLKLAAANGSDTTDLDAALSTFEANNNAMRTALQAVLPDQPVGS